MFSGGENFNWKTFSRYGFFKGQITFSIDLLLKIGGSFMKLSKYVAYVMKSLKEKDKYARTFVQKIIYFALPEDERRRLFKPYLYGPYSEAVQRLVQFLEKEDRLMNTWGNRGKEPFYEKVDNIINWIDENNLKPKDIAYFSKIHFIDSLAKRKGITDKSKRADLIKEKGYLFGWKEIYTKKGVDLMDDVKQIYDFIS